MTRMLWVTARYAQHGQTHLESRMSRRVLGTAALAAGILATGLVPFVIGSANAAACPSWTDNPGDATTNQSGVAQLADDNMDIVAATLSTSGTDTVATIKVKELNASFSDLGDRFKLQFSAGGKIVYLFADRDFTGDYAGAQSASDPTISSDTGTATWDTATDTVTIKVPQAAIDIAATISTKGLVATGIGAGTGTQAMAVPAYSYDSAPSPSGTTFTVGAACSGGGGPAPTGSPTSGPPTTPPPASTAGEGYPASTCTTFTDATGDGVVTAGPNDPDLDITAAAINTTPTHIVAFIKIATLGDKPANYHGDRFDFFFTAGEKTYTYQAGRATSPAVDPTKAQQGTTTNAALKFEETFDKANNFVIIKVERAGLNTVHGSAIADGTTLTAVGFKTHALAASLTLGADTAQATAVADRVYKLGESPCFPPLTLAYLGKTTTQFSDAVAVSAKVTNPAGAAMTGKDVTFKVGTASVTAKTGADGIARASLNPGLAAGSYSLVTTFAGDSAWNAVSAPTPFTVAIEKTRIVLTVAKSGTKRTVTAKLLDDDGRPVAGQVVTWYINGKKVSAPKTNASGAVTLTTAKPTQTVKAVFATVTGKYAGSTAQAKV